MVNNVPLLKLKLHSLFSIRTKTGTGIYFAVEFNESGAFGDTFTISITGKYLRCGQKAYKRKSID